MQTMASVVKLTAHGLSRVLNGHVGMTFVVDKFTGGEIAGPDSPAKGDKLQRMAHVRDYRYPGDHFPYQIWSLGEQDYEVV